MNEYIEKESAVNAIKALCIDDGKTPQMIWSSDAIDAVREVHALSIEDIRGEISESTMNMCLQIMGVYLYQNPNKKIVGESKINGPVVFRIEGW